MAKNKKIRGKGGITLLLVIVFVLLFGAGTCFAYPYIETALSPKTQVLTALKSIGEECSENSSEFISELTALFTGETSIEGDVTFTRAELDGVDYLKKEGYNKAAFNLITNAKKQSVSGTVGAEGSLDKCEEEILLDRQALKELLKGAGYEELYYDLETFLDFVDADTMKEYMGVADRMNVHMQSAVKVVLDKSVYTKNGKCELEIAGEQVQTTQYTVTITKEALLAGLEEFFNQVYDDSELSSYTTMFATFTGCSRQDLSTMSEEIFENMTGVDIFVYLNKDKKPVKLSTEFDTDFCLIEIEASGTACWNESTKLKVTTQRSEAVLTGHKEGEKSIYNIAVRYHEENDNPYGYFKTELERQGKDYICREGILSLKADEHELNLEFDGACSYRIQQK